MYRFKLEALLNHRRHQEEVCQKDLAQAQRQLADEQGKLRRYKREKRLNVLQLQDRQKENINVAAIVLAVQYLERLSKTIAEQKNHVREAARRVNQKRRELLIVVQKRKTLERLKDKQRQAYRQKSMLNERKLMDEVASTRHARET